MTDGAPNGSTAITIYDARTGGRLDRRSVREQPTVTISDAVADLEGAEFLDLEPLCEHIDPESVDRLVRSNGAGEGASPLRLSFRYHGYRVTVRTPAPLEIDDADETFASDGT